MSSKALAKGEEKEKRPEQILYRITDFENHETIGTGAFSRVRLVRNILEDQMRCVKVIKKLDIISRDLLKYVRGEAYLLRTCDHPFLLRSLGKYQDASSIYIVFELLRGGDLHHRLKALGTLPEKRTLHCKGKMTPCGKHRKTIEHRRKTDGKQSENA